MKKQCVDCNKESEELFYMNYYDLVEPFTGIVSIGNGFCLSCYRKKFNQLAVLQAHVKN